MSCHFRSVYVLLCFLVAVFLVGCNTVQERRCFSTVLEECWIGETCEIQVREHSGRGEADGICTCLRNHKRNSEGYCIPVKQHPGLPTPAKVNSSKSSSASIAVGVLVPLLCVGVAALVLLARRHGWWQRLRQPRVRQYDTALVGGDLDDDPPIA